ncbi:hypothetical protein Lalb_Chr03g0026381 [Lupinus albus]|uniref:Uncharacterized protein n=1 Tax=Lupinus albus TaxID=3870 RepID=A0A6A4QSS2_LUPAL|nr:hypothetical protein Lalb_Chr03g0026381 [Lupinus albus]
MNQQHLWWFLDLEVKYQQMLPALPVLFCLQYDRSRPIRFGMPSQHWWLQVQMSQEMRDLPSRPMIDRHPPKQL